MLLSLALIFLLGLALAFVCKLIKLPSLLGFIAVGIVLGPYALNLIDNSILDISTELRQIALIIILTRAGLSLDISDLKKIGRPAILMCFVPAVFEMIAVTALGYFLFNIAIIEALIMGSVLAAVSPAVIVPRMLNMMEQNIGTKRGIPQLIMAGASVDDIFVIVLFATFTGIATGDGVSVMSIINIPLSIILGAVVGIAIGILLVFLFKKIHIRDSIKVIILLSISFLLIVLETAIKQWVGFSGLIAIMTIGITILTKYQALAKRLSNKFSKLWVAAEILLFVLVGAAVDITLIWDNIRLGLLLIFAALFVRMVGVWVCLIKTHFDKKEKLFCAISYTPKATVQAAIGAIPLAIGIASGNLILSMAVLSIILTAPIGAYLIDFTKNKLISTDILEVDINESNADIKQKID